LSAAEWELIRRELLDLVAEDQRVRAELAADASLFDGYHPRMQAVHDANAARLATIIAREGDVPALYPAMLEDRIRCFEGRPQRFGTQFDWDAEGRMSPLPLEDPDQVDRRRNEIGLKPLGQDLRERREALARSTESPPADWAARRHEMEAWCKRVGWRE
jgi:hypothetical protein